MFHVTRREFLLHFHILRDCARVRVAAVAHYDAAATVVVVVI